MVKGRYDGGAQERARRFEAHAFHTERDYLLNLTLHLYFSYTSCYFGAFKIVTFSIDSIDIEVSASPRRVFIGEKRRVAARRAITAQDWLKKSRGDNRRN